jgi:iron complex transport system substrate-binding protein
MPLAGAGKMQRGWLVIGLVTTLLCAIPVARAEIVVTDATGADVRLDVAAQRIVSLAPHITELLYAAGAGDKLVGNVDYGDYPVQAKTLPRVGGYTRLDLEAILALKPDLVVAWQSGNPPAALAKLRAIGITVFVSQPDRIADVAVELEHYGQLAGTEAQANAAAARFRARLVALRKQYAQRPVVDVFYQIWKQPLMTINDQQIISDAIHLCGGRNVFGSLLVLAPTVTVEAVLAANPEAIVASGMGDERPEWLDDWRRWNSLTAVARDNLYFIPPQEIQRHTPRLLDGAEKLCRALEATRAKRPGGK